MGISWNIARLLAVARRGGHRFDTTLTLGRLGWFVSRRDLRRLGRRYDLQDRLTASGGFTPWPDYAEPWLHALGATDVQSMDASSYEEASIVHDLNDPVPATLHRRFDAVIDGGTLEHVFNWPQAIANAMQMCRVGGSLFVSSPCNNYLGHGLWQVSPALFHSVLTPENGFRIEEIALTVDRGRRSVWYRVADPRAVGGRVEATTRGWTILLVHAVRTADVVPFARWPQQSDYSAAWEVHRQRTPRRHSLLERTGSVLWRKAPSVYRLLHTWRHRVRFQPKVFRRINP